MFMRQITVAIEKKYEFQFVSFCFLFVNFTEIIFQLVLNRILSGGMRFHRKIPSSAQYWKKIIFLITK